MTAPTPSPVTDEMVERGARAIYDATLRNKPYSLLTKLNRGTLETQARAGVTAALDGMVVQGWRTIDSAPKQEGLLILVSWEDRPGSTCILCWKANHRIANRRRDSDVGTMQDCYFGDPQEHDDYDLADPKNFPTHWQPLPSPPKAQGE